MAQKATEVCKKHFHSRDYCKCRKCAGDPIASDFFSRAPVSLPELPWERANG